MGFNVRQPGRTKRADLLMLAAAITIVAGLVIWAAR